MADYDLAVPRAPGRTERGGPAAGWNPRGEPALIRRWNGYSKELAMRRRLTIAAAAAAALFSVNVFALPARAADAGVSPVAETRVYAPRHRASRVHVPRRYSVVVYPRYRYARPRIIWQVDASSVQPAYILR
jgi:hypothetical protein